jgi:hypothetical protein
MNTVIKYLSFLSIILFASCDVREDYDLPSWDVNYSSPLAKSSVTFQSLFSDTAMIMIESSSITIIDTVDVNMQIDEFVLEGSLSLIANNSFPFNIDIEVDLMNDAGLVLQSLRSDDVISTASVDEIGNLIPSTTILEFPFYDLTYILDRVDQASVRFKIDEYDITNVNSIDNNSSVDITLVANFNKLITNTIVE